MATFDGANAVYVVSDLRPAAEALLTGEAQDEGAVPSRSTGRADTSTPSHVLEVRRAGETHSRTPFCQFVASRLLSHTRVSHLAAAS
jgi:hypothetical protein